MTKSSDPGTLAAPATGGLQSALTQVNPAFFAARRVVPLGLSDGVLDVGMEQGGDAGTVAALQFATGLSIRPVPISTEEIDRRLSDLAAPPTAAEPSDALVLSQVPDSRQALGKSISLLERFENWLGSEGHGAGVLGPLARLLSAGYSLPEAGAVLGEAHDAGEVFDPATLAVAEQLRRGASLELALRNVSGVSGWIKQGLAACQDSADHAELVVSLVECEQAMAERRGQARLLLAEILAWTLPTFAAWFTVSLAASVATLLVAAFVFSKVRNLTAPRRDSDPTRSEVLGIVSVMAGLRVTPADAIRVGLTRLDALEPTWGRVPDGREDLAAALRLRPLSRAILMRGDLAEAARRLSRDCAQGAETRLIRCRWLVRCVGGVSLGAALALLLA